MIYLCTFVICIPSSSYIILLENIIFYIYCFYTNIFRSSFRDCTKALILTPTHFKAILRGAHCCFGLKDFESCKKWCDKGLKLDPKHEELLKLRTDAVRIAKEKERDERKRQVAEKKKAAEEAKVIDLLRARGFKIEQRKGGDLSLADLEPCHPAALHKPVHLDQQSGSGNHYTDLSLTPLILPYLSWQSRAIWMTDNILKGCFIFLYA